jgi:hypothetical protein
LNIPARVSPQYSLQHWQSQQGSAPAFSAIMRLPFWSGLHLWSDAQTAPQT